jgi:hypothetical protein
MGKSFSICLLGELMVVNVVGNGASLRMDRPISLFSANFTLSRGGGPVYQWQVFDVSKKDQRFVVTSLDDASRDASALTVIVNWESALKK